MSDSLANPWTVAHQAPLSMEFLRQEYWSAGCHFLLQGDLPGPGIKPMSPALAGDALPLNHHSCIFWLTMELLCTVKGSACVVLQKLHSIGKHKSILLWATLNSLTAKDAGDNRGKIIADILDIIKKVRIKSADYTNSYFHPSANISSTK